MRLKAKKLSLKAISCEKYTRLTSLFVRLLRCKNGCIARLCAHFYALQTNKNPASFGYIYSWQSPNDLDLGFSPHF